MKKTFQDILSSVKTALTSDTGKAIGMGIASTAAGALLGGEAGVQAVGALGSAVQNARERKKREEREAEDRDLRKVQMTKAELDLDASRENITGKRLDNIKKVFGDTVSSAFLPFGGKIGKGTTAAADKYGKIGEHDVAVEDKTAHKYGKISEYDVALEDKVKTVKQPGFKPTPIARTGPASAMVNDEEQLVKNIEKIQTSAAGDAAALAMKNGYTGKGREFLLQNRDDLAKEVQSYGFEPEYEKAFWRELQEQIAPGSIARAKAMLGSEPEYTGAERIAMAQPGAAGSTIGATTGMVAGSIVGGPVGAAIGTAVGSSVGGYVGKGIYGALDSQKDVTPTPAVAGADKTAADMAEYSMSLEAKMLLRSILKTASQTQNIPAIIQQLPQLADFKALPVGDQERVLYELQRMKPQRPMMPQIGMNYGIPKDIELFRDTINDMGSWATRKLGIGR